MRRHDLRQRFVQFRGRPRDFILGTDILCTGIHRTLRRAGRGNGFGPRHFSDSSGAISLPWLPFGRAQAWRRAFSPRQIERAVVEFDHVTFADQPMKIGGERELLFLAPSGSASSSMGQFFQQLFAVDARDFQSVPARMAPTAGETEVLSWLKGRARTGETKSITFAMPEKMKRRLPKSADQLLHHFRRRTIFLRPGVLDHPA